MLEQPRPDANSREQDFTLTIEEASDRYATAGHPRTIRAIQKYCARGDLDCQKAETPFGQRYLITPASVARHIAQIVDVSQTNGREQPRPDALVRSPEASQTSPAVDGAPVRELSRPDAYVQRLEGEVEFLRGQIGQKDKTIDALLERDRETNILTGRLQEMLTPLLAASERPAKAPEPEQASGGGSPQ